MPVLGKRKRVLTVRLHELADEFFEANEQFFVDEEGYDLEKANIPYEVMAEVRRLVEDDSHLELATHICFID